MDPLLILVVGLAIVVGGILVLRAHAFLALVVGALVVAALTSPEALESFATAKNMTAAETCDDKSISNNDRDQTKAPLAEWVAETIAFEPTHVRPSAKLDRSEPPCEVSCCVRTDARGGRTLAPGV